MNKTLIIQRTSASFKIILFFVIPLSAAYIVHVSIETFKNTYRITIALVSFVYHCDLAINTRIRVTLVFRIWYVFRFLLQSQENISKSRKLRKTVIMQVRKIKAKAILRNT